MREHLAMIMLLQLNEEYNGLVVKYNTQHLPKNLTPDIKEIDIDKEHILSEVKGVFTAIFRLYQKYLREVNNANYNIR